MAADGEGGEGDTLHTTQRELRARVALSQRVQQPSNANTLPPEKGGEGQVVRGEPEKDGEGEVGRRGERCVCVGGGVANSRKTDGTHQ